MTKQECIKGETMFLNWLVVAAFRYSINRHKTRAMSGIDNVILNNLDVIKTVFIRQFVRDIEFEQNVTDSQNEIVKRDTIDFFACLKRGVKDYKGYLENEESEKAKELYGLLCKVDELIPQVDMSHKFADWKINDVEDTSYLTPMLEALKAELVKRGERP